MRWPGLLVLLLSATSSCSLIVSPAELAGDGGTRLDVAVWDSARPDSARPDRQIPDETIAPDVGVSESAPPADGPLPQPDTQLPKDVGLPLDGPPSPDKSPPVAKDFERTLTYSGTGNSEWLHVIHRVAGAGPVTVRSVKMNENLVPPCAMKLSPTIYNGQCKAVLFSGAGLDGTPFSTTVTSCLSGHDVTISHTSIYGTSPPTAPQVHGTVSMDPAAVVPYERSLHYVGSGGGEYLHVARRPVSDVLVDLRTVSYNAAIDPAVVDFQVLDLPDQACKSHVTTGTVESSGDPCSAELKYCRANDVVTIQETVTINGILQGTQVHGVIPIE